MKNMAIVDSGPLIALFDLSDRYHQKAKRNLEKYRQEVRGKLITTWPIITEVAYLLKEHVHFQAQLDFLKWIGLGGLRFSNSFGTTYLRSLSCKTDMPTSTWTLQTPP